MSIPIDKQAHAISGALTVLFLVVTGYSVWHGLALCLVNAVGKEIYDYYNPKTHTCDVWDAVATMTGGVLAAIYVIGVNLWM